MTKPIQKVFILGGGTAGWLTALSLKKVFGEKLNVLVVESPRDPIIGVGEATVPTIRFTMRFLGFKEEEWMPQCQSTYKTAVRFQDWCKKGSYYYHPFHHNKEFYGGAGKLPHFPDLPRGVDVLQRYAAIPIEERTCDFANFASSIPAMCDRLQSPVSSEFAGRTVNYAYHFDTYLLNQFFQKEGAKRGVLYKHGKFQSANLDENGFIKSLVLEDGRVEEADLFIDCTGFQALLIDKVLKEPFLKQSKYLLCDSAVAVQIPYQDRSRELEPYTSAIAQKSGWVWRIPLQHRIGTGYVYSSDHSTREEALEELQSCYRDREKDMQPRYISMRVGRHERTWVKNCVAIGLAGSFIEPLESTSIGMTEYQIHSLIHLFPNLNFDEHLQDRFNEKVNFCYDQLRDYIVAHYFLSKRNDTKFWKDVKSRETVPDSLAQFLMNLKSWIAAPQGLMDWVFFQRFNWACILSGMEALPHVSLPILDYLEDQTVSSDDAKIFEAFPKHEDFISAHRCAPNFLTEL